MSDDPMAAFSAATRSWFAAAFPNGPTAAQAGAWGAISGGRDALVVAPTGSGKTLAAFLWSLDRLASAPRPEKALRCRVLYVSPLKALAADIQRNLDRPLAGIAREAGQPLGVQVAMRTGDTPAAQRRNLATAPPDVLITTPESLFLVLTSQARAGLAGVETVILDEVHALAGTKRGAHLALSLERLDALTGRRAQRIGLSATVRPAEEVARFLGGAEPAAVVAPPADPRLDVRIRVPVEDMTGLESTVGAERADDTATKARSSIWPHVEEGVLDLVEQHRSSIVFTNARRVAERLCARLNELATERAAGSRPGTAPDGDWELHSSAEQISALPGAEDAPRLPPQEVPSEVAGQSGQSRGAGVVVARAHHGSVSKEERAEIEADLKEGRLRCVVATSSLELGIDMGAVDLVVQVESPPSVASGLQRVGRAGHHVGAESRGVFVPKFRGDLLAATVVAERMRQGAIEEIAVPANPLDVLAQQIVAMAAMDEWPVAELGALVRRAAPFAGLPDSALSGVLDMLSGRYPSDEFADLRPRVVWDRDAGTVQGRPGAQRLAVVSGGTIPDRGAYAVHLASSGDRAPTRVGELDEEMVYESRVGDVFVLGSTAWRIESITPDRVLVTPAPGRPGRLPFWKADQAGRPAELGRAIGAFVRGLEALDPAAARERAAGLGLDEWAADNLVGYLEEQREATGSVPDDRTVVVERFRDELGDWRVVLHSPLGARVHAPWAMALGARLRERFGLDAQVVHGDDGIVLRLPDVDDAAGRLRVADLVALDPEETESLVTAELGNSALFAARFRECSARALLLPRQRPGKRMPLWQQRQRSAQLLSVASRYGEFPIVLETVRECLRDVFDVPGLVGFMGDLAARRARIVEVQTEQASPFAQSLLIGYTAAFLYEGDAPLAELKAQALTLDSELLADLLGQADLRELLDAGVVDDVEAALQRLTPDRRVRPEQGVEDTADLLRELGPLTPDQAAERGAQPAWLDQLEAARRAIRVRLAGAEQWAAAEDAARLRDALGTALPAWLAAPSAGAGALAAGAAGKAGDGPSAAVGSGAAAPADRGSSRGPRTPGAEEDRSTESSGAEPTGGTGLPEAGAETRRASTRTGGSAADGAVPSYAAPAHAGEGGSAGKDHRAGTASPSSGGSGSAADGGETSEAGSGTIRESRAADSGTDAGGAGRAAPAAAAGTGPGAVSPAGEAAGQEGGAEEGRLERIGGYGSSEDAAEGGLTGGAAAAFAAPVADPLGDLLSRHARTHGPFTAEAAAARFGLERAPVRSVLARLAGEGRLVEGGFRPGGQGTEWCDPGVLRRLRRASVARLREEVEPVPQRALASFVPAWQNAAPDRPSAERRRLRGPDAVFAAVEGLRGCPVPASALESLVLPARVEDYSPAMLDELTAAGEVLWAGVGRISASDGWVCLVPSDEAAELLPDPAEAAEDVLQSAVRSALDGGGALFFRDLSDRVAGREGTAAASDAALVGAVWDLVWAGVLANDTLAPLRALLGAGGAGGAAHRRRSRRPSMPSRSGPPTAAGRWWVLPEREPDPTRRALAGAEALLDRYGLVTRGPVVAEQVRRRTGERTGGGFGAVYPVLRGIEEAGRARRGYFVEGLGAAQFALPGAVDRLRSFAPAGGVPAPRAAAGASPGTAPLVLAATDPANVYGAALSWPDTGAAGARPGRKAGALVVLDGGVPTLYLERGGRTALTFGSGPDALRRAAGALADAVSAGRVSALTVERADGAPVFDTPLDPALSAAGFHPTPKGLRLR
ncbi:DEAD/DEAH box helicase [Nocardiopsis coralliicola]